MDTALVNAKPKRLSYLLCGLLAVILFGSYVLFSDFQNDRSATMAPNLPLGR
jgi:hypothetical protein